jgi:hypothetical protein
MFKLDKKISHGPSFLVSYTYGRSIDQGSGTASGSDASGFPQNNRNLSGGERGLPDFNVRPRLVISPVWALPFGHASKNLTDKFISDWQISGIFQLQTGRPFTPNESGNISLTSQNADRANVIAGCKPNDGPQTVNQWINTSCITLPAAGTFGDVGRNTLIGPGMVTVDTAVARVFSIKERMRLQLRGEAFNTANHPNFQQANGTQNSPLFGRITATLIDNREIQIALKLLF